MAATVKKGIADQAVFAKKMSVTLLPLLFMGALVAGLLYSGGTRHLPFCLCLNILFVWTAVVVWECYHGISIPKTALSFLVVVLWGALGLTMFWSPVYYVSHMRFWIWGGMVLPFLGVVLLRDPEIFWHRTGSLLFLAGILLSLFAAYQHFFLHEQPRATFLNRNSLGAFLNMIILVQASAYLIKREKNQENFLRDTGTLLGLFCMVFAQCLVSSRGATVGLWAGAVLLCWTAYRYQGEKKRTAAFGAVVACCYLLANNLNFVHSDPVGRIVATARAPVSMNYDRFITLKGAWEMLHASPWYGRGFGTFWLAWPPFQHPADESAGYFVHNDYLQLWIEGGLPALVLITGLLATIFILFVRSLQNPKVEGAKKVEITGLFAAIFAVSFHSFFSFNFYILSILILFGLVLGRFHVLVSHGRRRNEIKYRPSLILGKKSYFLSIFLLLLIPVGHFTAMGASFYFTEEARDMMKKREYRKIHTIFEKARRFWPEPDFVWGSHAEVMLEVLRKIPEYQGEQRRVLFEASENLLAEAEKRNPLQPQIFVLRGLLFAENQDLAGEGWKDRALEAFYHVLQLNPRYIEIRTAVARILLTEGKKQEARMVLESGVLYAREAKRIHETKKQFYTSSLNLRQEIEEFFALQESLKRGMEEKDE